MNESMRKIVYYENILEFKENTNSELHLKEVNDWQICRTCLVESKDGDWDLKKMCVMDVFNGKFINAQDMLGKVVNIQFLTDDNLPEKLCKDCLEKLTTLYFYTMQVQKAEKVLKNLSIKLRGEKTEDGKIPPDAMDHSRNETEELEINDFSNDKDPVAIEELEEEETPFHQPPERKKPQSKDSPSPTKLEGRNFTKRKRSGSPEGPKLRESNRKVPSSKNADNKENYSIVIDENLLDNSVPKKESPCSIPKPTETVDIETQKEDPPMDEDDEGYEVYLADFEEKGTDNEDEFHNTEETADTTVEIYLSDEDVEVENGLEDKYNIEDDKQNIEKDTEVIDPNVIPKNETNTNTEPLHLTRSHRPRKPMPKIKSKHRQPRVTKPLLQSRKCAVCKESFQLQRDLVAHVKENHPNSKAYQCRECGQLFSYTQSLSRHMNCHKDELHKFQCTYCPKAFLRAHDLTRHIRTHTGERPYKCPKCDKAFKQQGEMKQHLTTHLERRSYECDQCYCEFTSRNSLYLHRKANHSKTMDEKHAARNKQLNLKKLECSSDDNMAEQ